MTDPFNPECPECFRAGDKIILCKDHGNMTAPVLFILAEPPTVEETLAAELKETNARLDEALQYIHHGYTYNNRFRATERIRILKENGRLPQCTEE